MAKAKQPTTAAKATTRKEKPVPGASMLDVLRFVKGAVSTKDFVPALTHFQIKHSRITGFNGKISLCAPIALDIDCVPKAQPFVDAIEACTDTAQLNMTVNGKLHVRSGTFRAHVECIDLDTFPEVKPEGVTIELTGPILPAFRKLYDFTAEDASRPWATGVLLDGHSAFASNNVVIIEHWLGFHFPFRINVPRSTIREMLRIDEEPLGMQATEGSVTFHYSGQRWLRSALNSVEWPDIAGLFEKVSQIDQALIQPVHAELFDALDKLKPFLGEANRVWVQDGALVTAEVDGASVELPWMPTCSFNHKMLGLLRGIATEAAFAVWPSPVPFYGDNVRGVIACMR
jgi:hypothetical protein